jgi:probable phosphoglycerate mutase
VSLAVLLIRHAQADVKPGRLTGWTPGVHLTEEGRRQAKSLGERLRNVPLQAIYCSPLERCQETAEAIAEGRKLEIKTEPEIGEVKYGSWQGRKMQSLAKTPIWRVVQMVPSQARFPGGESLLELQQRGVAAVEILRQRHKQGVVAVVSHADTIKATTAHYLGMHLDLFQRLVIANASVTAFLFGQGVPRLLRLSDTGSYEDLVPVKPKPKPKP